MNGGSNIKVLGLNGWNERGHDGGATIMVDGKLIAAIEEEKLIGLRHAYDALPLKSINYVLRAANLKLDDIDRICIGWDYPTLFKMLNQNFITNQEMSKILFGSDKYANKIVYLEHHLAHAYSTFYPSNYKEALVLVLDGQGELMATSLYKADRDKKTMELLMETPVSLGYFYSAITNYIGFRVGEEGKTMGLASYGKPVYIDELRKLLNISDDNIQCAFVVNKIGKDEENETINKWFEYLKVILPLRKEKIMEINDDTMPYANLASSAQVLLEEILCKLVTKYYHLANINHIAVAGGVGLNCPSITAIENLPFIKEVFVQPAANDGGISLGAAIKAAIDLGDNVDIEMIPYLGPSYNNDEILETIKKSGLVFTKYNNIEEKIADLLVEGNIVANFQERLEFGPRALGNRSLLASPESYDMLIKLNTLKGRELWRPLAPAVLYDKQEECFDTNVFSPYMTKNCNVLESKKNKLMAITHVDGTARIQSVTMKYNEMFYKIIKHFYQKSGIPVIINTSFNIKGYPIVCHPMEAIDSALQMDIDYLAMGDCLIKIKNKKN